MKTKLSTILLASALLTAPLFLVVCSDAASETTRTGFMEYFQAHRHEYVKAVGAPGVITFRVEGDASDVAMQILTAGSQTSKYILVAQAAEEEIIIPLTFCEDEEGFAQSDWSTDGKQGCVAPPASVIRYAGGMPPADITPLCMMQDGSVVFFGQDTRILEPPHREAGKAASRYDSAALDAYLDKCVQEGKTVILVSFAKGADLRDIVAFHQIILRHPGLQLYLYTLPAEEPEPL